MAPKLDAEFIILRIIYVPFNTARSNYAMERNRTSTGIIKMAAVIAWFESVMSKEKAIIPRGMDVRYSEWSFKTNDPDLVTANDYRYDEIYVVLGGELVYWLFYGFGPNNIIHGGQLLPVSYCACCLNFQYLKIISTIKKWIAQQTQ